MSAELLRQAATILRERAEAATPGPWEANMHSPDMGGRHGWDLRGPRNLGPLGAVVSARMLSGNAHYIATMHPGVGLALAKWLDDVAAGWPWDDDGEGGIWDDGMPMRLDESQDSHALALARLIVGADR